MLDLSWVDDRDRLESPMRMVSDSWPMSTWLWWDLPGSIVVEHEKWTRITTHLPTISWDILRYTETIAYHMVTTRMFEMDYFLLHTPILEKYAYKSTLFYKVNNNSYPYHSNHWYIHSKLSLSCLMIEWCLHSEPYTSCSSEDREDPESKLRDPPPLIDRSQLIDPHDSIRDDVQDDEVYYHWIFLASRSKLLFHFSVSYPPIRTISIVGKSSRIFSSGTHWSYPKARIWGVYSRIGANISDSCPSITDALGKWDSTVIFRVISSWMGSLHFPEHTRWSRAMMTMSASQRDAASVR